MSSIVTYKGLKLVTPTPAGNGGKLVNDNIKAIADLIEQLQDGGGNAEAIEALQDALDTLTATLATKATVSALSGETAARIAADANKSDVGHTHTSGQVGLGSVSNVDQTNADNLSSGTVAPARLPAASTSTQGALSAADKVKLNGIATGATANQTDAYLLSLANHTGNIAISNVTSLQSTLDNKANIATFSSYLKKDGTTALTGNLNLGSNNITSVNQITDPDGTSVFDWSGGDRVIYANTIQMNGGAISNVGSITDLYGNPIGGNTIAGIGNDEDGNLILQSALNASGNTISMDGGYITGVGAIYDADGNLYGSGGGGDLGVEFTPYWAGPATWLDFPSSGPSGIGTGGPGVNAWIARADLDGNWFGDALSGDVCYRNTEGRLIFGVDGNRSSIIIDAYGLNIYSPNGNLWNIKVNDDGILSAEIVGDGGSGEGGGE